MSERVFRAGVHDRSPLKVQRKSCLLSSWINEINKNNQRAGSPAGCWVTASVGRRRLSGKRSSSTGPRKLQGASDRRRRREHETTTAIGNLRRGEIVVKITSTIIYICSTIELGVLVAGPSRFEMSALRKASYLLHLTDSTRNTRKHRVRIRSNKTDGCDHDDQNHCNHDGVLRDVLTFLV